MSMGVQSKYTMGWEKSASPRGHEILLAKGYRLLDRHLADIAPCGSLRRHPRLPLWLHTAVPEASVRGDHNSITELEFQQAVRKKRFHAQGNIVGRSPLRL